MRTKWDGVYQGNSGSHATTISSYFIKYAKYIFRHSAFVVTDLKGEDLFNTIATAGHTSQGMDHWAYADLTLLPASAFHYLALLLNLVEQGKPWPDQRLFSRAHLLSKNPEDTLNPLEDRFLMITSSIYRLWGKTRLKHLEPWINLWRLPNMYGGLQGAGADDAWYATSVEVEHALLHNLSQELLLTCISVLTRLFAAYCMLSSHAQDYRHKSWQLISTSWSQHLYTTALEMPTVSDISISVASPRDAHFRLYLCPSYSGHGCYRWKNWAPYLAHLPMILCCWPRAPAPYTFCKWLLKLPWITYTT